MNDVKYHNRFFKNLKEAKQFQKEHGYGVLYKVFAQILGEYFS